MHAGVVVLADSLGERRVAPADGQHLDVERRTGQRGRVLPQGLRPIATASQQHGGCVRSQPESEPHRGLVGEATDGLRKAGMDRESRPDQPIGRHTPPPAEVVGRLRRANDGVCGQVGPGLVKVDPVRDDRHPRHPVGHDIGGDVVEQRMEAGNQRRTGFECPAQLAPKAAADGVLEEPHRGLYVREVIGEPPEDGYVPRDRSIQRGQPPGHDPLVRHGVEAVDHKPVRVAQLQRRGDRLRGGAMPSTGVGEEKEKALGGGHGRGAS